MPFRERTIRRLRASRGAMRAALLAAVMVAVALAGCATPTPAVTLTPTASMTLLPSRTPAPSLTPFPSATPLPSATPTPRPTPTVLAGQLRFPDLYQIGGSTLLEAGAEVFLIWQDPPPAAIHYDFFYLPFGKADDRVLLGSDTSDADGVGVPWNVPRSLNGALQASAYFTETRVIHSERVSNVYSGSIPLWNPPQTPAGLTMRTDLVPYVGDTTLSACRQNLALEDPPAYQDWRERFLALFSDLETVEPGASCRLNDDTVIVTFSHTNGGGTLPAQTVARFTPDGELLDFTRGRVCPASAAREYPVIQRLEAGSLVLACATARPAAQWDTFLVDLETFEFFFPEPDS